MPIFFQQPINGDTTLAVWKIEEDERFFLQHVPLQRHITHPHKRLQHLAGRYLLQYLFPDFPVNLIKIADTRKPYLENEAYHFSISHCGNYAAAIVSKSKRVGVDIEVPTHKVQKIAHKFLHEEEIKWQAAIGNGQSAISNRQGATEKQNFNLSTVQSINLLTLLWCCKEAVFKWWSYGAVDFSERIRLQPFVLQPGGMIDGAFISEKIIPLELHYKMFDEICLAWVVQ